MPNWCFGTLTVTGQKSSIIRFLNDGVKEVEPGIFHVKGTSRGFVYEVNEHLKDELAGSMKADCECSFPAEFAWSAKAKEIASISKQYPLLFQIEAEEPMIGFRQIIQCKEGKILQDDEIDFDTCEVTSFA